MPYIQTRNFQARRLASLARTTICFATLFVIASANLVTAQQTGGTPTKSATKKKVHDAVVALKRFTLAPSIRADVFAADPQVANPVSFCIDEKGRIFVCETYRQKQGVEDNRDHEDWVPDDLAAQTVEERIAFYKKHLGDDLEKYTKHEDRIRMLVDRDGNCLLYTSPSPRDATLSRMPSSA